MVLLFCISTTNIEPMLLLWLKLCIQIMHGPYTVSNIVYKLASQLIIIIFYNFILATSYLIELEETRI